MFDVIRWLLSVDFMPHVYCLREPLTVALHAVSDGLIALSYFVISGILIFLVRSHRELPFRWMYVLFAVFILACGITHVLGIVTLWHPVYRLEGMVKAITALASVGTAVVLVRLVPHVGVLPGSEQFRHEIEERRMAAVEANKLNADLEIRVRERTAELLAANAHQAELAAALDATQAIIQRLDGTIVHWTSGAESMYGWSRDEAVGRTSVDLLRTEYPLSFEEVQTHLLKHDRWNGECRQRCRDGSFVWVATYLALYRNAEGDAISMVRVNNDITELKRASEALRTSEATARSLFENAGQGILTADREGRIVNANAMVQKLFGYTRDELIGASLEMLLPEQLRGRHIGHRAGYAMQPHARTMGQGMDLVARRKDASEFPVEISLSHVAEHENGLSMAFVSDTTARLETRRLLLANNEDLARALARAHEASEHKSRFLASMSHELRTPLNAIIGFTEIVRDGRAGGINEMQEEFLGDSLGSARQLLALINDILDLEKVASGRRELTLERFDVHQLVRETVQEVSVTAAANEVRVIAELAESVRWVFLDRQKTKQALLNLASNAVKFTPDGGLVTVRARAAGSQRWILEVEDTGIGISEEDQTRLFREFEQLDTLPAKSFKGTGLGLVLAKSMVEAQGGTIAVVSRVGAGSTFSAMLPVTLERRRSRDSRAEDDPGRPLNSTAAITEGSRTVDRVNDAAQALHPKEGETAPAIRAEPGPGVAPSGYGRRVLILDDDPNVQKLAKLALRDAGLEAVSCMDGESGLSELARSLPTAMIVDLMMPKLDGFNFLSRLRQIPSASTVPVLVWTNLDLSEQEMAALQLVTRQVIYKRDGGIDRVIQELEKRMKERAAKGTDQ